MTTRLKQLTLPLFIILTAFANTTMADYFQADLPSVDSNASLGTHLIITGKGLEVGDQWLRAAHTQALVFKSRTQHGPIRLIGAIENSESISALKNWGYKNIQIFNQIYTGLALVKQIKQVPLVASIDMIGHNGAMLGFALENYENRFFLNEVKALEGMAKKMSPLSFVRVMGCNTGWNLAPALAKALAVPVGGTFTFADIQKVHESNDWFFHDEGRFPGGQFLSTNTISTLEPISCIRDGGCMRLKPVHIPYQGVHGSYAGTVPFMKTFCGQLKAANCQMRMALSMHYAVSVVSHEKLPDVADHFCPGYKDAQKRIECKNKVIDHMLGRRALAKNYSTSSGPTVQCSLYKCDIVKDCSSGSCIMRGQNTVNSTTFVHELDAYINGYTLLQ
jgi:hypothetical protein